jgi:hypothetical protein
MRTFYVFDCGRIFTTEFAKNGSTFPRCSTSDAKISSAVAEAEPLVPLVPAFFCDPLSGQGFILWIVAALLLSALLLVAVAAPVLESEASATAWASPGVAAGVLPSRGRLS